MSPLNNIVNKIIVALDVKSREEALALVDRLPETEIFKVGLQMFSAYGPPLLTDLKNRDKKVFLDLKLHDIPNTVAGAVRMSVHHGIHMMTLHASGGREMLERAVEAAAEESERSGLPRPLLLAVTVLTSLKEPQLQEVGISSPVGEQVCRLAELAHTAGTDGVVCSPQEIELIRENFGSDLLVVAPGIRPLWAAAEDQKRIMTPAQAVKKGADYLVIGRPITKAPSPGEAFKKILGELEGPYQGAS